MDQVCLDLIKDLSGSLESKEGLAKAVAVLGKLVAEMKDTQDNNVPAVDENQLKEQEAAFAAAEAAVGEKREALKALEEERQVLDALEQIVSLYQKQKWAEVTPLVEAPPYAALERLKAFRMVREKVQLRNKKEKEQGEERKEEQAEPKEETKKIVVGEAVENLLKVFKRRLEEAALDDMGKAEELNVPKAVAEFVEEASKMGGSNACDALDGAFLLIQGRFAREPDIPLYVGLRYQSFLALSRVGKRLKSGGDEGRFYLAQGNKCLGELLGKVEEDLRKNIAERREEEEKRSKAAYAVAGRANEKKGEAEEAAEAEAQYGKGLIAAAKQCVHEVRGVVRGLAPVLTQEMLWGVQDRLASFVLEEALVRRALDAADLSVADCNVLARTIQHVQEQVLLPALVGVAKDAPEHLRRGAVSAWPRARKLQEILDSSLATVEANLPKLVGLFSSQELTHIVKAVFKAGPNRDKVIEKLEN